MMPGLAHVSRKGGPSAKAHRVVGHLGLHHVGVERAVGVNLRAEKEQRRGEIVDKEETGLQAAGSGPTAPTDLDLDAVLQHVLHVEVLLEEGAGDVDEVLRAQQDGGVLRSCKRALALGRRSGRNPWCDVAPHRTTRRLTFLERCLTMPTSGEASCTLPPSDSMLL